MPLYEYRCTKDCGIFEEWRALADTSLPAHCPICQQTAKRVLSAPALLSGSLRLKQENRDPQLVQHSIEPKQPRVKSHGGRPWMIGH
jgi:putative FmdB family regulatory protein